jgi:hypothetical protein
LPFTGLFKAKVKTASGPGPTIKKAPSSKKSDKKVNSINKKPGRTGRVKNKFITFAPGARIVVRDAEWMVRRVDRTSTGGQALTVTGISELVRDKEAIFLTEIDKNIEILDPVDTKLVHDESSSYQACLLYKVWLIKEYYEDMGPTAYTLLNIISDIASRPIIKAGPGLMIDTYQKRTGHWVESFIKEIEQRDFVSFVYLVIEKGF